MPEFRSSKHVLSKRVLMTLAELSSAAERHDAFEVLCLREEVKGLHRAELVACLCKKDEVPHLGGGIAGDIDDASGSEGEELLQKLDTASGARRVDEHDGVAPGIRHVLENVLRISGNEAAVESKVQSLESQIAALEAQLAEAEKTSS